MTVAQTVRLQTVRLIVALAMVAATAPLRAQGEPPENAPTIAIPGWSASVALTFGLVVTVVLGVLPEPIVDLAVKAAHLSG